MCLPYKRKEAVIKVTVNADGSIQELKSAFLPEPISLAKKCMLRRLDRVRFRAGDSSTTHLWRISSGG
ncbi:MAG TPA: hypothetical protein ENJ18_16095 [Nannocystis exedens]|nr:hypothetical protein [Nannocystis exedens]